MSRLQPFGCSLVCLALALAPCAAIAGELGPPALFQPSPSDEAEARAAYERGSSAYRVGNFEEAATAFEAAYELSGLPDILYNIGLAHLRLYEVDLDAKHLRKAKAVFNNYLIELERNPELGDAGQAETLIAEIDDKLAAHRSREPDSGDDEPIEPVDRGPDPGRGRRLGGTISLAIGGVFVVGGVASAVAFGASGQAAEQRVVEFADSFNAAGCTVDSMVQECQQSRQGVEDQQAKGRTANALAFGLGLSLGGVGVIGVITGAVLLVQGKNKTKTWEQARLRLAPSWSPGGGGLVVSGSF